MMRVLRRTAFALAAAAMVVSATTASQPTVTIPEFWSEELLHDYELPLATPENTPKHISRDYYYALPERALYKSYPIYHPSREPAGYLEKLRTLDPEPAFAPAALDTEADWIAAGREVFEMPISYNGPIVSMRHVRDPAWYERHQIRLTADGVMPYARYVVRGRGDVAIGNAACAMCHTRVLPDGTAVAGAQGNFPFDPVFGADLPSAPAPAVRMVLSCSWPRRGTPPAPHGSRRCPSTRFSRRCSPCPPA
jgi:hypothetical protein